MESANNSKARRSLEESLAIYQALGDQWGIADSLGYLALVAGEQAQFSEAERLSRESIAILRKTDDRALIARILMSLDSLAVWQGKFIEARPLAAEIVAILNDLGCNSINLSQAHALAGYPDQYSGRYEEAWAQAQRGLTLCRETNNKAGIGLSISILGRVDLAREAYDEAQQWFQECIAIYQAIGAQNNVGQALACLSYALREMGQRVQAQQHIFQSLRLATERRDYLPLVHALPGIALLLADQGEKGRAVELYALATTQGIVANSQWFEDIAGRHITAVATTLPPEVVAAAEARGRARDLWEAAAELLAELEELGWGV